MRIKNRIIVIILVLFAWSPLATKAQTIQTAQRKEINQAMTRFIEEEIMGGGAKIQQIDIRGRRLRLYCSIGLANYPFREESVKALKDTVRHYLPNSMKRHSIEIYTDGHAIEELIPLAYRSKVDRKQTPTFTYEESYPLVKTIDAPHTPTQGLQNRHIALWQSHGRYFDQDENRWRWQRTAHWQTREDLFTQSFVLPYLVPMLERAGACVLLPRERDQHTGEWIADNDSSRYAIGKYSEQHGKEPWHTFGKGFAWEQRAYTEGENPFQSGTCRATRTTHKGDESLAQWEIVLPEAGTYMLYASYASTSESCPEARYTIHHAGGKSVRLVNQRMGGGTWIPLGEFSFNEGRAVVTLSNRAEKSGQLITADAIRIGGGWGNIARIPCDSLQKKGVTYRPITSGMARSMEGARYWLQWAGFDTTVYAPKGGIDDYKEDYMSRAHWVNALMGGSERLPNSTGLGIPIDLALAFHTDAGVRDSDETIGTLGIFYTQENEGMFEGGVSRYRSRDLTDLVMTEIVEDIRATMEPTWRRRGLWNRSYYEARVPAAPTMLLELLSHQNLADMRYGHDPRFKFLVARAIYKGIVKHIASQYGVNYCIQPLPIKSFSIERKRGNLLRLSWQPRIDEREESARPEGYLLYTAIDDGAFDQGVYLRNTEHDIPIEAGHHYHFRVSACNAGGESFPSEQLSAYIAPDERGTLLIINGFTRVSAAPSFRGDFEAGFSLDYDGGAAWGEEISYIGHQTCYERSHFREQDPGKMLGACTSEWEGRRVAGNHFHYPALHGRSIAQAGYSYVSSSAEAIEEGNYPMQPFVAVDLILGKQRSTLLGSGSSGYAFKSFPDALQQAIEKFTSQGISLFVSGSYVASDLWESGHSTDRDRHFARTILHYEYTRGAAAKTGELRAFDPSVATGSYHFQQSLAEDRYAVESPDGLAPVGDEAFAWALYPENEEIAATAYRGENYRTVVMGVPFESLIEEEDRHCLMAQILDFLIPQTK